LILLTGVANICLLSLLAVFFSALMSCRLWQAFFKFYFLSDRLHIALSSAAICHRVAYYFKWLCCGLYQTASKAFKRGNERKSARRIIILPRALINK